ncbi:EcsC family protein [Jeotgalibacillus soli]|uniref:EcsC family protein n=1 Tax=Jeotgalibacillus soli TaxID=889306 RepID=A0A0C2VCU8_9BACL|nr:EcsC family protein [Jeotgalibacillus soli]KIL46782.1 hypothetical protein KP78_19000 [Jeotgalibacillus soli]
MESRVELYAYLDSIEKWEKDQGGLWFWEKVSRLPFKLLDRFTPQKLQEKIGLLLDEVGHFVQNGGKYLTNQSGIIKKINDKTPNHAIEALADFKHVSIETMNTVAKGLRQSSGNIATAQGASTGIGGLFTLAADIPLLLGLSFKTLQDIAVSYGYDPTEKTERIFIIKCLQFASSDIIGKQAVLNDLMSLVDQKERPKEMMSLLQGWREVVFTYRDSIGWKKLFQLVPIAGMIFGAFANRTMIHDIAETGAMLYQKRRVLERLHECQTIEQQQNDL